MGDALARREADRAIDQVEMISPVPRFGCEIDPVEQAQSQQELEAFAGRRRHMHGEPLEARRHRLAPDRFYSREIGHGQRAAERLQMRDDFLAESAAIEMLRPLLGDLAQRLREIRLDEHGAQMHRAVGLVILRPGRIERGNRLQERVVLLELRRAELGQRETVPRQRDGRREDLGQGLAAIGLHQLAPAGEIAGRGDGERAALQVGTLAEPVSREACRDRRHEIEHAHALLGRDPHRRETHAGEPRHEGLDHVERGGGGGSGVEGVAALCQ